MFWLKIGAGKPRCKYEAKKFLAKEAGSVLELEQELVIMSFS